MSYVTNIDHPKQKTAIKDLQEKLKINIVYKTVYSYIARLAP